MAKQLGVYICSGCSIGEVVDTAQLSKVATDECKAAVCRESPFLCGSEGLAMIRQDLGNGNAVDGVVIAACSPRMKTEAFDFNGSVVVERVNLREHVAWCHEARHEDTQMLAEDYLRMGAAKARKVERREPLVDEISKTLLVVGGGITGLTAALEAADAGYDVVLVEKEAELGGFVATVKKRFPFGDPSGNTAVDDITAKVQAVLYHSRIRVFVSAKIVRTDGQPGNFRASLETLAGPTEVQVGAIVMATGWKPYDASRLAHLGYGTSSNVVTNVELEQMVSNGEVVRPSDRKRAESVLFIQCAGSRDKDHLPYCSSVCCNVTLMQATYLMEKDPEVRVFIIYKDMRTPGAYELLYRRVQDNPLVFLTKGEVARVDKALDDKLGVTVRNTLLGQDIILNVDLVVLATGMVPNSADGEAIRTLEDARIKMESGQSQSQQAEAARVVDELDHHDGTAILNLTYRQGPDLPVLRDGFPDSHFVCFPYETRRTGIYAAGAVRAPMTAMQAQDDGLGASLKAIQSVELAAGGRAVHPRAGDTSYPNFFLQRCTQCKRCTEECPFGAIDEDEKGTPKPNPYRCRRCGICLGACPERIISFGDYSVDMVASMIKAIEVPDEFEEKPRVLVLMCENDAYPALDIVGLRRLRYDASVRVIPVRCLGSVNIVWIADALSRGIDGVMLIGCKYGDDYQCHFIKGSELANRRLENVKETLERLQLEPERLSTTQLAINEWGKLPVMFNEFVDNIREMGPNPYKGF